MDSANIQHSITQTHDGPVEITGYPAPWLLLATLESSKEKGNSRSWDDSEIIREENQGCWAALILGTAEKSEIVFIRKEKGTIMILYVWYIAEGIVPNIDIAEENGIQFRTIFA